ncbi:MAG: methylmalonyl-CoA mutase family protein, partial [Candidatus Poseidoniia archaeon]
MKVENDSWLVTVWTIRGKKIVSKKDANSRSAGNPPYRRGIHPGMYRDRLWTMRQYAGFSSPTNTNNRFKKLLDSGQTGLSIAFDLPT